MVDELPDFLRSIAPGVTATPGAVCLARRFLRASVFTTINSRLVDRVRTSFRGYRWHGLRVMAVDGSTLNLLRIDKLFAAFGGQHTSIENGKRELPMARLSQLHDVGTQVSWHALVEPYGVGEAVLAAEHIEHAPEDAVILYDRGYPSFYLAAQHRHDKRHFCMRVARGFSPETDRMFEDNAPFSRQFDLIANADAKKLCAEHDIDAKPLTLRVVRCNIRSGREVLLTSLLDTASYPSKKFKGLYSLRWTVEGDFKVLKSRLQMENWTGRSDLFLRQDVHSRILTKNLVTTFRYLAQRLVDTKRSELIKQNQPHTMHRKMVSMTSALHRSKFRMIKCLLSPTLEGLQELVRSLATATYSQRKGRTAPRSKTKGKSKIYAPNLKPTC